MRGRRGFLKLSGIGAVAAADPEQLLWRPGKLISIPKPFTPIQTGGDFILHPDDCKLDAAEIEMGYIRPAMICIAERIDYKGYRNFKLAPLPLPRGVDFSQHIQRDEMKGRGPVRHIKAYDVMHHRTVYRLDVLVVPGRM